MQRTGTWIGGFLAVLLLLGFVAWRIRGPRNVPLGNNSELRILKVTYGTDHVFSLEPAWKRTLRRILPPLEKQLGLPQQHRTTTGHASLVLWVDECQSAGSRVAPRFEKAAAVLDGDIITPGPMFETKERMVRITFQSFARDQEQVPLQLIYDGKPIRFTIRNPARVTKAAWTASPLPQTNFTRNTRITLSPFRRGYPVEKTLVTTPRATADTLVGWMTWRITAFDDLGNWTEYRQTFTTSPVPMLPLPRTNSVWRVHVDGTEYISAGFVAMPTPGSFVTILPNARARSYGVQSIALADAGEYVVTNGIVLARKTATARVATIRKFEARGTNWFLHFQAPAPCVVWLNEIAANELAANMRLRERLPQDGGKIFRPFTLAGAARAEQQRTHVASLAVFNLPSWAVNLELEVIGTLSATDFFINPP